MKKLIKNIFLDRDENDDLVVIIPPEFLKKFKLKEGSEVDVRVEKGQLYITPVKKNAK
jgi:antitoxin component of MazEF toxin-antitoxin module